MNAAIRQYRAIQALAMRAETHELATVGSVALRPEWSPADGSQMEMSANATVERELRILETIVSLIFIAAATACTAWLAMGGVDLIRELLP